MGIDPHHPTHTWVALDDAGAVLGQWRVDTTDRQVEVLHRFATAWSGPGVWAVENPNELRRVLSRQLQVAGRDGGGRCPPTSPPGRAPSPGTGHKTDAHDARRTSAARYRLSGWAP